MPRYHFHLHECGQIISDDEGIDLPDVAAAHEEAVTSARELIAAEVQQGRLCLRCRIEVVDEQQRPVLVLPFTDAVEVVTP